jgi:hypothetical protein
MKLTSQSARWILLILASWPMPMSLWAVDQFVEKWKDTLPWTSGALVSEDWQTTQTTSGADGANWKIDSKTFKPTAPWTFVPFRKVFTGEVTDTYVDILGDPGTLSFRKTDTAAAVQVCVVYYNSDAALFPFSAEGNLSRTGTGTGGGGGNHWAVREGELGLTIEYLGGKDAANGSLEENRKLLGDYLLKGYILKCTCLGAGTNGVTWTFKKGATEVGTFHASNAWTSYASTVTKPNTATVYWRSDYDSGGNINDVYTIEATYGTPPTTVQRTLKSRSLSPTNQYVRDRFNEDSDMLQRAMIQVFFLDKGRLSRYFKGKYTANIPGQGDSLYISSLPRNISFWSAIADEVENLGYFALEGAKTTTLALWHVTGLWNEFDRILSAGNIGGVTNAHAQYANWRNAAITAASLTMPTGFARTSAQYVDGVVTLESSGKHSYIRIDPLAVNNVQVGENAVGSPLHTYTDDGLGFMKVQPYNRGTCNLYKPDDNLLRGAQILSGHMTGAPGAFPAEKAWRTYVKYNSGNYGTGTPQQQRAAESKPAYRADKLFGILGLEATVRGQVYRNGQTVEGATVTITCQAREGTETVSKQLQGTTNGIGLYTIQNAVFFQTVEITNIQVTSGNDTFSPMGWSPPLQIEDSDEDEIDFIANVNISGTVTKNGAGLAGVTVSAGGELSAVTGAGGTYTITNVPASDTYVLTPTKIGETFTPATRNVEVEETNVAGQDFAAN